MMEREDSNHSPLQTQQKPKTNIFETQMSQDPQIEEKQFSPWVRKKTNINREDSNKNKQTHQFLAKINISSKAKNKTGNRNEGIEQLKADLNQKIQAQKIQSEDYIEIIKRNRRTIENKGFFQRRAAFSKMYHKPKSIQLSLEYDQKKMQRSAPYYFISEQPSPTKKKQYPLIKKIKSKKPELGEKQFNQTFKEFRKTFREGMNLEQAKKVLYKTLQLKINTLDLVRGRFTPTKQEIDTANVKSTTARSKFLHRDERLNEEEGKLSCEGRNLKIVNSNQSRRFEIKHRKMGRKNVGQQIFLK